MSRALLPLLALATGCHLLLGHQPAASEGSSPDRAPLDGARGEGARGDLQRDGPRADGARGERAVDGPRKKDVLAADLGKPDLGTVPAGTVLWAKGIGGPASDYGRAVAVDPAGNVYIVGGFTGKVDFNPGATPQALSSQGGMDAFVASYDAAGKFRWAKPLPSTTGTEIAYGVAADAASVYVTGSFGGTSVFVVATPTSSALPGWSQTWGASGAAAGWSLALDASSNLYVAGFFTTGLTITNVPTPLAAPGQAGFAASLTSAGGHRWSQPFVVGGLNAQLRSVAVDGSVVYLAGYAGGEGRLYTCATGTGFCSATETLGPPTGLARALAVAAAGGKVYLTGTHETGANLGGSQPLAAVGLNDLFARRSGSSGTLVAGLGSTENDEGNAIVAVAQGAYVVGQLGGPPPSSLLGAVAGFQDPGWLAAGVQQSFGNVTDVGHGVAVDPSGSAIYVVGTYSSATLKLGAHTVFCGACTSNIVLAKIKL